MNIFDNMAENYDTEARAKTVRIICREIRTRMTDGTKKTGLTLAAEPAMI